MVFKPRVLLGFHPNPRFLESRVGKTLNGTKKKKKKIGFLPLRLDSWFNCKLMEFGLEQTLTNLYVWFMYEL